MSQNVQLDSNKNSSSRSTITIGDTAFFFPDYVENPIATSGNNFMIMDVSPDIEQQCDSIFANSDSSKNTAPSKPQNESNPPTKGLRIESTVPPKTQIRSILVSNGPGIQNSSLSKPQIQFVSCTNRLPNRTTIPSQSQVESPSMAPENGDAKKRKYATMENSSHKPKQIRSNLSEYQTLMLECYFHNVSHFVNVNHLGIFAHKLSLGQSQVQLWFSSRRLRETDNTTTKDNIHVGSHNTKVVLDQLLSWLKQAKNFEYGKQKPRVENVVASRKNDSVVMPPPTVNQPIQQQGPFLPGTKIIVVNNSKPKQQLNGTHMMQSYHTWSPQLSGIQPGNYKTGWFVPQLHQHQPYQPPLHPNSHLLVQQQQHFLMPSPPVFVQNRSHTVMPVNLGHPTSMNTAKTA